MNYYDPLQYNPYLKPPQQPVDGLTWVDGIDEVNSYPLPPNSQSPALMWRDEPKFSIKRTDNYGGYTVRTFSFTEDEPEPVPVPWVTKDDFESFKNDIMEAINGKPAVQPAIAETEPAPAAPTA